MPCGKTCLLLLAASLACVVAAVPAFAAPPTPEQLARIRAALPAQPCAKPKRPRRLLIFTLCKGYRHSSIECGAEALRLMGAGTGAYEAVVNDDPAVFGRESLAAFDGVCLLNTTGELFTDAQLKQNLLDFVRGGKGLVGIHAATDCFYEWPEYGELIGAYFDGHPWHANDTVTLRVEEPGHPLCAAFATPTFTITDEIYQFRAPYSRDRLRVLLSLDPAKTDMHKKGMKRTDGDYAVSWIRAYGQGRVFYCSLGHREDVYWNPVVLKHYLAGIQYALGDLPADAAPRSRTTTTAPAGETGWIELFNGRDLTGWTCKPGSWAVEDGTLVCRGGGYIWTEQTFGDFVLELDFKIGPKGNSGIFFRTANPRDPVQTGIEFQILDSHGKPEPGRHDCGAIYDCCAPRVNAVKPAGEWNHVVLACRGSRITAVLNDVPIISMDLDEWTEPHRNPDGTPNKFNTAYKDMPRVGHIGFQDHGDPVWFRNIRIRVREIRRQ